MPMNRFRRTQPLPPCMRDDVPTTPLVRMCGILAAFDPPPGVAFVFEVHPGYGVAYYRLAGRLAPWRTGFPSYSAWPSAVHAEIRRAALEVLAEDARILERMEAEDAPFAGAEDAFLRGIGVQP